MLDNIMMAIGWAGSQQIIAISLLRYLILVNSKALYLSQFLIRLACILLFLIVFLNKIFRLQHPRLNTPHQLGRPFRFSFSLVFFCSLMEFVSIAMAVHSLKYYSIVHFAALFTIFKSFFRSWINNVTPITALASYLLMGLGYLLEDWIYFIHGASFDKRFLGINEKFEWKPLVMVIAAAASRTLGIQIFKHIQFQQLFKNKGLVDKISWANYINDEPEKIQNSLAAVNALFSRYLEAQLIVHCEQNSIPIHQLKSDAILELLNSYFDNHLSYSYQYMEQFHIFNFNKEALDDIDAYAEKDTLLRKMIKQRIFTIQLQHQQFKELFGIDKYQNLSFEVIFQDYGIHEYIWDEETPFISLSMQFFQGIFCLIAAYFNEEQLSDYFSQGYDIGLTLTKIEYYVWIAVFLGILQLGKIGAYKLIILWEVQTYFFSGIFLELGIIYLTMIWIENITYIKVLGLIISYIVMSISYRSAEKVRDQKNKLFYLNFVIFLVKTQKFTNREGSHIIQLMTQCCEHLSLNEFLKVLSQMLCIHGIVSCEQLRHMKFSHFGESPLFKFQIPFIFQSQLRYENNIENDTLIQEEGEIEQMQKSQFTRYVIESKYQENKSDIKQGKNVGNSRIQVKSEIQPQYSKIMSDRKLSASAQKSKRQSILN
ncbi:unnamed protein product (macronuclear) [Paramecium tetraurelia]|uniref:Transmembrane protein n=1 Tax=Paramecium tetraurelia TaxID=5888 RepID=A0D8J8_PARTE|nr:uncharacterized protein GSPATT00014311001 [Paramecium tetraurelia]CAK79365.1 unnamed protein product [Paramecium tetraurelia]|eukprot:XP_001446762.1 hypothetical protein (macronuclear) [Paramecium tetraurelia strain d4-2]